MSSRLAFYRQCLFLYLYQICLVIKVVLTVHSSFTQQIWVASQHNGSGYFNVSAGDHLTEEHFTAMLANDKDGNRLQYARTGYLGFVKRTELTQTDGGWSFELHL